MNPNTQRLHALGQSLWLDNISREILNNGTLKRYIDDLSLTGLTSNPTIFEKAIGGGTLCDRLRLDLIRLAGFRADATMDCGFDLAPARPALQSGKSEAHD